MNPEFGCIKNMFLATGLDAKGGKNLMIFETDAYEKLFVIPLPLPWATGVDVEDIATIHHVLDLYFKNRYGQYPAMQHKQMFVIASPDQKGVPALALTVGIQYE